MKLPRLFRRRTVVPVEFPQDADLRACEARLAHYPPEDAAMLRREFHASAAREPGPTR